MKIFRKTKIIGTLGPSSSSVDTISSLIKAGMDIARINLSHGDRKNHTELIKNIKKARKTLNKHTAILLDTRGPEIRVGGMAEAMILVEGRQVFITGQAEHCTTTTLAVTHEGIAQEVIRGSKILLDDGKLILEVEKVEGNSIKTRVIVGGILTSNKRVSLPGIDVDLPSVSPEDREDILFGIEQEVDFFAASFIRKREDILHFRQILAENGGTQHLIAKIENRQGVKNIEEILAVSDGLMVARGDLGVEVAAEEVPIIQKRIIRSANAEGKPVITATQMLESMISSPSPTRAEASDVSNAVMDGSDAVMLSGETAMGKYPLEAIQFLSRCTEIAEMAIDYRAKLAAGLQRNRHVVSDAIAYASCAIATDLSAAAILSITTSGSTARKVAMYRPRSPVIALSPCEFTIRKLQIIRGVIALYCQSGNTMDEQISNGIKVTLAAGYVANYDTVTITGGLPLQKAGTTNLLRVHAISEPNTIGN